MAEHSPIEWTEATWNPIAGCSVVSPGCTNCYAMRRVAPRLAANPATPHYAGTVQKTKAGHVWTGRIGIASDKVLTAPLRWRRPRRIFVNSTSDLFHEDVPDAVIDRVFAMMALCPQHTFQVLTKRATRMREYLTGKHRNPQSWPEEDYDAQTCIRLSTGGLLGGKLNELGRPDIGHFFKSGNATRYGDADRRLFHEWPLANVWLGVSAEDQTRADERIPELLATPAAVRFVSAEPLLGPIDLTRICLVPRVPGSVRAGIHQNVLSGRFFESGMPAWDRYSEDGTAAPGARPGKLDWVIVGGESGSGARPMHPDWARSIRDQCASAGVPFFFKQWGEWHPCTFGGNESPWYPMPGHLAFDSWNAPVFDHQDHDGWNWRNIGKHAAGRLLDGVAHDALPVPAGQPREHRA